MLKHQRNWAFTTVEELENKQKTKPTNHTNK